MIQFRSVWLLTTVALACVSFAADDKDTAAARSAAKTTGPQRGSLIAIGGGSLGADILDKFIELAGGTDAPIVYVPTAMPGDVANVRSGLVESLKRRGCSDITILHTRDRAVANSEAFIKPLKRARGVWFSGGRQLRFVDAYLNTRTVEAFRNVLKRGGVIAGSSAGATIQGSYLVRGAPEGNQIMMAKGHEEGFAFLHNAAIDQHVIARRRLEDLIPVIRRHPELLGIGIDEGTAIVVQKNRFEVIGPSKVAIYDHARFDHGDGKPYFFLQAGDKFDLVKRRVIEHAEHRKP